MKPIPLKEKTEWQLVFAALAYIVRGCIRSGERAQGNAIVRELETRAGDEPGKSVDYVEP